MPVQLSDTPPRLRAVPPTVGQHNAEILGAAGYEPERIAELVRTGRELHRGQVVDDERSHRNGAGGGGAGQRHQTADGLCGEILAAVQDVRTGQAVPRGIGDDDPRIDHR